MFRVAKTVLTPLTPSATPLLVEDEVEGTVEEQGRKFSGGLNR